MSQLNFTSKKIIKRIRNALILLFALISIIKTDTPNTINMNILSDFFDDYNSFEICGDKYLAKTKSGEVYLSSDLGYNWSKLNLGKVNKIISFENTDIYRSREKYKSGNKFKFDFLKYLLAKKTNKEKYESELKLITPEENAVFISSDGKIQFSKSCGYEFLNMGLEKNAFDMFHPGLDKKVLVKDFVFHPYNQEKGIVIAYDEESRIFHESEVEKKLIEVYLTENFGKTFRQIHSFNNEELKKYYDFTWFPLENSLATPLSGRLSDFFIGTFLKSLTSNNSKNNNQNSNNLNNKPSSILYNKSLLAFYFENNIDNNDYNTKDLETKITYILKNYIIELAQEKNVSPTSNNSANFTSYIISSMQLIEGSFDSNRDKDAGVPSHSMVLAVNLISGIEKKFRNLQNEGFTNKQTSNRKMKVRVLNSNNKNEEEDNYTELNLFFEVRFDLSKKGFSIQKINFNVDNNIQINFPNDYEEVMKISENENFVFYIAKRIGRKFTGDLFVASKDRNLWTLAMKNMVLTQSENTINQEQDNAFVADFINVANSENIYIINIYNKDFGNDESSDNLNLAWGIFFERNRNKIQTFITFDSGKSWNSLKNDSNTRINLHLISSWINCRINPIQTSYLGGLIANGSEGEHLIFPSKDHINGEYIFQDDSIKTFISHDFGLIFNKMKDHINVFSFANYGNMVIVGESSKPTDTISITLDQGKSFLNYKTSGSLIMLDRIYSFDNNKIIAKKFANYHFYNNQLNKMHVSKKTEMLSGILDFLGSEKDKIFKENMDGFLSKNPSYKGNSDNNLIKADIEKRARKIILNILNSSAEIPFDTNMLVGIQAHTLNNTLLPKVGKYNLNKATMEIFSLKTFFTLNLNSLLHEKSEANPFKINLSVKTTQKNMHDLKKLKPEISSTAELDSEFDKRMESLYQNIFNIKTSLNKSFEYKHYFNKEDSKNFNILLNEKMQKKTHLPSCTPEDFEIKELNNECVLGKKEFYFSKKKNIVCIIDNYALYLKKKKFIENDLTVLLNIYLENNSEGIPKLENLEGKIALFLTQIEPLFKVDLENFIPEILNSENFIVEKTENCNCDLLKDFSCDEMLKIADFSSDLYDVSTFNSFKKNLIGKNTLYNTCIKYLNYISNPASERDENNKLNSNTGMNSNNNKNIEKEKPKANNFEIFKSSANSCFIGEKLLKIILSAKAENKSFNIEFNKKSNLDLLTINGLSSDKNFNFDLIQNKDKNKKAIGYEISSNSNQEDSFKTNEQAGFGFLVISFIAVIFVLFVYMGYLIVKNIISTYFPYKKARSDEHYDDPSEVGLKVKTRTGKSKELDSIY